MFEAVCKLGLEGIVSKRLDAPYRSGRARSWIRVRNPKAPAATRAEDGTFSHPALSSCNTERFASGRRFYSYERYNARSCSRYRVSDLRCPC
jgi:hypothetical protein